MNFTDWGKSVGMLGRPKLAAPLDWWGWPLALHTVTVGAVGSKLIKGASLEKYNPLAPESTITVRSLLLRRCCNLVGGDYD